MLDVNSLWAHTGSLRGLKLTLVIPESLLTGIARSILVLASPHLILEALRHPLDADACALL